jgi:hypothetical protein
MPRPRIRRTVSLLLAFGALLGVAAPAAADTRPFAADSVWNLPLRADAPLNPRSSSYVGWLRQQVAAHGAWINTTSCGVPIFWAGATTRRVRVRLSSSSYQDPALIRAWSSVPMPSAAKPANCADKDLAVLQLQPDGTVNEWEFWRAAKAANGNWSARWGGAIRNVAADRGVASSLSWPGATRNWNVTATSISLIAGVITEADARAGAIGHAVALALPDAAKGRLAWPAQRTDGGSTATYALPQGSRLRLDPTLDLSKIQMAPLVRMIAEAAQRYGVVVRDRTYSTTSFIAQEPQPGQSDPFKPLLGGKTAGVALKAFPWSRLQLLQTTTCAGSSGCTASEHVALNLGTARPKVGSPLTLDTSNSALDQPRSLVRWDLNGDGIYEAGGDRAVKHTFVPMVAGTRTIAVRITTRSGSVVIGRRTITVAPAG